MKLYYNKNSKDPIYYAQQGFRNGKKVTTKNVRRFGRHSELLATHDDPLAWVKSEIAKMNEEYRVGKCDVSLTIDFNQKVDPSDSESSRSTTLNTGYLYLKYIYEQLDLKTFFKKKCTGRKLKFDPDEVNSFLTYARILDPDSKLGTFDRLDSYYDAPSFSYNDIHRFMDFMVPFYNDYIAWLYNHSDRVVKRDSSVIYYDCTNFYFETERCDDDYMDPVTGEIFSGLRKYGVSKEHRPNPIVEMGLIMDSKGIPVTMCIEPGNTNEQTTAVPLEKELLRMIPESNFIYCADAGLGSVNIRKFNSMGGRHFIVTQSIKKLSKELRKAVFNDCDYKLIPTDEEITRELKKGNTGFEGDPVSIEQLMNMDFSIKENADNFYNRRAYKVISADRLVDLGLDDKGCLKQNIIITYSPKMRNYQRTIRERQIERAKRMLETKDPEKIKKGPNDVRRFIKSAKGEKTEYILDEDKIREEEMYDGYYAVATNIIGGNVRAILSVMEKRNEIEANFRIMKTWFDARPVYHYNPDKIRVHFLICYTALLVYRLLEAKLDAQKTHITVGNLIETMKNMNVVNISDTHYQAVYTNSEALKALEKLTLLTLDRKNYKPKELNRISKKITRDS